MIIRIITCAALLLSIGCAEKVMVFDHVNKENLRSGDWTQSTIFWLLLAMVQAVIIMSMAIFGYNSFTYEGTPYNSSWHDQAIIAYTSVFLTAMLTLWLEFTGCAGVSITYLVLTFCAYLLLIANVESS